MGDPDRHGMRTHRDRRAKLAAPTRCRGAYTRRDHASALSAGLGRRGADFEWRSAGLETMEVAPLLAGRNRGHCRGRRHCAWRGNHSHRQVSSGAARGEPSTEGRVQNGVTRSAPAQDHGQHGLAGTPGASAATDALSAAEWRRAHAHSRSRTQARAHTPAPVSIRSAPAPTAAVAPYAPQTSAWSARERLSHLLGMAGARFRE